MSEPAWDHHTDLLIVGSGAAGMSAALAAHDAGANVVVLEKSDQYGGSSAMSGGAAWIPGNHQMASAGIEDNREDAVAYLHSITGELAEPARIEAYVDHAPRLIRWLQDNTHVRLTSLAKYPDYYPENTGGRPGGRTMEPVPFSAWKLGDEFDALRPSHPQELVFGRIGLTAAESHKIISGGLAAYPLVMWLMARYYGNLRARNRGKRDVRLTLGNALMGRFRRSLLDREVPIWLHSEPKELIVEGGRVVGAVVERDGKSLRLRAEAGVMLAAGGFARNKAMRQELQRHPITDSWSAANPYNKGDGIVLGQSVGGAVALMDDAWWTPVTLVPGKEYAWLLVVEKSMPGSIMVNQRGERFTNEAAPYVDVVNGMYDANSEEAPSIPAYLIFDARFRRQYPVGPIAPGNAQPDKRVSRRMMGSFLKRADTLEELAEQVGVDGEGLSRTVETFNGYARAGKDPDFGRGESLYDLYYSDPKIKPNPTLGEIVESPFYAIEVQPGDLGTKGGLRTDANSRVLGEDGQVISGLYAAGNCSSAMMGRSYPGAGGTIGPAMVFGWLGARHAVGAKS